MDNKFSGYLKKKKPIIKKLVEELCKEYSYVGILGTDVSGQRVVVNKKTTRISPTSITECGFVIKVYCNGVYSEYSLNDIELKDFDNIKLALKNITSVEHKEIVHAAVLDEEELTKKFNRKSIGREYEVSEIIDIFNGYIKELIEEFPLVVNVSCSEEVIITSKMFISEKKDLEQHFSWCGVNDYVMVANEGNMKYAYDGYGGIDQEKCITSLKDSLFKTAKLAMELLDAKTPIPGVYDIITDSSITGLIAHEAFGHGVEMDMFVKHRAQSVNFIDKRVASPLITMHDGAKAALSSGSYFFDDDGILAQDTKIIEKGILKRGISDALSALQLGTKPTGNSRRQSYKRKAYTRMTNTFFEKGKSSLDDMIKSIDYGYYIGITNNGMEDPKNWGIQCTALYGREIKDGKFTGNLISPVVMSGYVIDLLNSITMVSNGFEVIGSGSCGKGYKEWVRVSDGGPNLKAKVKIG